MEYGENNIKFFKLNQEGKEYILSISIYEDYIRLSCQERNIQLGNYYETDFSLNDLSEINRFFLIMSSIYEAQNELIKAIEKQKVGIEVEQNLLNLLFYLIIGTDNILIKLPLAKRDKAYNRMRLPEEQEPFTGDIHLKNKGNYPDDENRIINIEEQNKGLKQSQFGLINDMQNLLNLTEQLKKETSLLYEENAKLITRLQKIKQENDERNSEVNSLKQEEQILNDENIKLKKYNSDLEQLLNQKKENLQKNFLENKQKKLKKYENNLPNGPKAISSRFENVQVKTFIPRVTVKPKVEAYEEGSIKMRSNPFYHTDKRRTHLLNSNFPTDDRFNRTDINIDDVNNPKRSSYRSNYNEFNSTNNSKDVYNKDPNDNYNKKDKRKKQKITRISERTNDYEAENKINDSQRESKSNQADDINSLSLNSMPRENLMESNENFFNTKKKEELEEQSEQEKESGTQSNDKYMNSDIVKSPMEESMLLNKLGKEGKNIKLKLLYKATIDTDRAEIFHKKCDKAKSSIVFIETIHGMRFGGFTTQSWEGDGIDKKDNNAFVFSLDKLQIYNIISGQPAIGCYPKYGPVFLGCQIKVNDNFFVKGGTTYRKHVNYAINSDFELNDGIKFFGIKDLEVFEVTLI